MKLTVKGTVVNVLEGGTLIQNDPTPCLVEFVFDGAWDGLVKSVRFQAGKAEEVTVALEDDKCRIPEDCLKEGGVPLRIVVDGGSLTSECYTLGRVLYAVKIDAGSGGGGGCDCETATDEEVEEALDDIFGKDDPGTGVIYDGPYTVVPKAFEEQVLDTDNKQALYDVTVTEIPYQEVGNSSSGKTASIGQ